ncbi:hypothetical protein IE53DRAFT_384129 [Violaceomyces palustris]|uniref:Uncharacterized protein n=1 Tax=Violaceomyces palustris TaxID=1673888 RepID=A0ACD0P5V9_9BASI|nr:hypothetical protein IE53DRAFT_384129 [Violaceomyces palustris]
MEEKQKTPSFKPCPPSEPTGYHLPPFPFSLLVPIPLPPPLHPFPSQCRSCACCTMRCFAA